MDIVTLGKHVRERREVLGLTQVRLARLANLSRQTVQSLETGTLKDLGFERVGRLLDASAFRRLRQDNANVGCGWRQKRPALATSAN